jgi:nucleoid DNA-binding protein
MRVKVDWRSGSTANYKAFKKEYPNIDISIDQWRSILYGFNDKFKEYILETGEKIKMPFGFGEFSINKKKRKQFKVDEDGKEFINLPVDWKKTKEKGKKIYNLNHHTEGYFFGWVWFKSTASMKNSDLWFFKAGRTTSRLLSHYINVDKKYQNIYAEWTKK